MRRIARRTRTTVVAIVGDRATAGVERLGRGTNVVPVTIDSDDPPLGHRDTGVRWPDLDDLLAGIGRVVPDQVAPGSAGSSARIA